MARSKAFMDPEDRMDHGADEATENKKSKAKRKPKLGSGKRFSQLSASLAKRPGVTNPNALAAYIGRKKYGNAKFNSLSRKGK
jgi:hypothetical protein